MKLLREQIKGKEKLIKKLDEEGQDLRKQLRDEIGREKFREEEGRNRTHMLNVFNAEKKQKAKKILRDTKETQEIKSSHSTDQPKVKKSRRFRR